jgi:protein disulfide-isomerase
MKTSLATFPNRPNYFFGFACFTVAILGLALAGESRGQQPNTIRPYAEWVVSYNKAVEQAKQTGRPIMLVFSGSDWCTWCQKLSQEVFTTHEFARWSTDNVIKVEVDFPMSHALPEEIRLQNEKLKNKFGREIASYPTVLFISADGEILGKTGYVAGGARNWIAAAQDVVKTKGREDLIARSNAVE